MQSFTCKTLNGNWFEDRCTSDYNTQDKANTYLPHPSQNKYITTNNSIGVGVAETNPYEKTQFFNSTDNWMNFQPDFDGTFKTTQRVDYSQPSDQDAKFKIKETFLTKDPEALEKYREKYTKAGHNFNRTYLGDSKEFTNYYEE